jgi:hypothetical protein
MLSLLTQHLSVCTQRQIRVCSARNVFLATTKQHENVLAVAKTLDADLSLTLEPSAKHGGNGGKEARRDWMNAIA